MDNWIIITDQDLDDAKVAELIDALRQEALREDPPQPDPVPAIIRTVVDEIRNCIRMCPDTPVDVDPLKISRNLKEMAVAKIVRVAQQRLQMPFSDEQTAEERLYQKRLEMLTRCEWPVKKPDDPEADNQVNAPGPSAQVISGRGRKITDQSLNGL